MLGRKPQLLRGGRRAGLHPVKVAGQNVRARESALVAYAREMLKHPRELGLDRPRGARRPEVSHQLESGQRRQRVSLRVALGLGQELIYRVDLACVDQLLGEVEPDPSAADVRLRREQARALEKIRCGHHVAALARTQAGGMKMLAGGFGQLSRDVPTELPAVAQWPARGAIRRSRPARSGRAPRLRARAPNARGAPRGPPWAGCRTPRHGSADAGI